MKFWLMASLVMLVSPALAMQCMPRPLEENFKAADIIFVGKVEQRQAVESSEPDGICWKQSEKQPLCGSKVATFAISKLWKGTLPDTHSVKVFSNDGCYCLGSYFETGKEYLVFANHMVDGTAEYTIRTVCDGTISTEEKDGDGKPIATETMHQLDLMVTQ